MKFLKAACIAVGVVIGGVILFYIAWFLLIVYTMKYGS